ncbi:glutamine amidotransferase family protein [Thermotoga sp. KOL6]|uniref:class II glutamine amidotransferase n=1 Tax=Thermotoga sp. KOL6 TaxID=126741 RepID=UPI000C786C7D|nr:hypothetical protein AS005_05070 [Thermotoga sp. KOL6]
MPYDLPHLLPDKDFRVPSACGISGIMNTSGKRFSGSIIIESMALMRERGNGLGAGYAAYGIYPELRDFYCFHMLYNSNLDKKNTEEYIKDHYEIIESEPIPTRKNPHIKEVHILWRYFLKPKDIPEDRTEEDYVVDTVMFINEKMNGAFVMSSGKNMGVFKGVGFPEDIGDFYRIDEYKGYIWTAHNRFPTNTVGWWGGAHPFGILDWTVVHNGEISSYGINRRFLEAYGYKCTLMTDTEVVAYLVDLFMRRFGYSPQLTAKILAAPLWKDIDLMPEEEKKLYTALRMNYGGALLNGPFAIIVANNNMMMGLNDRIKLRPLVAATKNDFLYIASEESAIRIICPNPDEVWTPKAGEPVIGTLKSEEKVRMVLEGENG